MPYAVTSRLTTPEEAKAFLASMRDKQKAATDATPKPPAHLTADGMDAWYLQQRERERLERERRKEAEALLRGYRMTMSHDKSRVTSRGREETSDLSTLREHLFDSGDMTTITENMDDREVEEERREVGRLSIDESVFRLSQHHYDREVGRLGLGAVGRESEEFTGGGTATHSGGSGNGKSAEEFTNGERAGTSVIEDASRDLKTPQRDEEKMEGEESEYENERKPPHSCRKFKGVPTPAKNLFPDETEWRDFVSSGRRSMHHACFAIIKELGLTFYLLLSKHRGWRTVSSRDRAIPYLCLVCLSWLAPSTYCSCTKRIGRRRVSHHCPSNLAIDKRVEQ